MCETLVAYLLAALTILGPGVLATADPGVLEDVEGRRVKYGYHLHTLALPGTVLAAVDDCSLLGSVGILIVEDARYVVKVVDCTARHHTQLEDLGLLADVNAPELNHKTGVILLWPKRD
jgi:hypothetical protein